MAFFQSIDDALTDPLAVTEFHVTKMDQLKKLLKFENLEILTWTVRYQGTLPKDLFTYLWELPKLHTLRINGLTEPLPEGIFSLKNLKHLEISGEEWEIADRLGELSQLSSLHLHNYASFGNRKRPVFPQSLFTLTSLQELKLLRWAPDDMYRLGNLQSLRVLQLEFPAWKLPDSSYDLPHLEDFHLITPPHFPPGFFRFKKLKRLLLEWKELPTGFNHMDLSGFDQLPRSLEELILLNNTGENYTSSGLAPAIFAHKQLQKLQLHRVAELQNLPADVLQNWPNLHNLYLSTQGAIDRVLLKNLFTLRNLQQLTLRTTEGTFVLPNVISQQHFPRLESLALEGCDLSKPMEVLGPLPRLKVLSLNYFNQTSSDSLAAIWGQLNPKSLVEFQTGIRGELSAEIARFQNLHTLYLSTSTIIAPEVVLLKNLQKYPDWAIWRFAAQIRGLNLSDDDKVGCMALYTGDEAKVQQLSENALWQILSLHGYSSDSDMYSILNEVCKILLTRSGFRGWSKVWNKDSTDWKRNAYLAGFVEKLKSSSISLEERILYAALLYGAQKPNDAFEPAFLQQALQWGHPIVFVNAAKHLLTPRQFHCGASPELSERTIQQFLKSLKKQKPDPETFILSLALLLGATPPGGTFQVSFLLQALRAYPILASSIMQEVVKARSGEAAIQRLKKLPNSSTTQTFTKQLVLDQSPDDEKVNYICLFLGIQPPNLDESSAFLRKALTFNHGLIRSNSLIVLSRQPNPLLASNFAADQVRIAILADVYGPYTKAELIEKLQDRGISVTEELSDQVTHAIVHEALTAEQAARLKEENITLLAIQHLKEWLQQNEERYLENVPPDMAANVMKLLMSGEAASVQLAVEMMQQGGIPTELYDKLLVLSCMSYYQYAPQIHQLVERYGQLRHADFFKKNRLPGNVESAIAKVQNSSEVFDLSALLSAALQVFEVSGEEALPGCSIPLKNIQQRIIEVLLKEGGTWAETVLTYYSKKHPLDITLLPQKEIILKTIQQMPHIADVICNAGQLKRYSSLFLENPHLRQITVKVEDAEEWEKKGKMVAGDIEQKTKIKIAVVANT